ncbi:DnaA ATPase domain-containing protein, partial [Staphylococcus aureus]|uniref:DnaA ATPase domain-containing protein n=1 Tax=Staphylococcus aureus TaxID=1280 RepID=UPI001F21DFCB
LIDDVHFIGGKKSSQEELFHTLAALMGEGRRVVFTADRPPAAIAEIDARLRSRMPRRMARSAVSMPQTRPAPR